jgi:hypothetical protein
MDNIPRDTQLSCLQTRIREAKPDRRSGLSLRLDLALMSNQMIYSDGTIVENSIHPQVDSGFGFTCDEEILLFIQAFYSVGMRTLGSCQGISAWSQSVVISPKSNPTAFPRRWIAYHHDDPLIIFEFARHIRDSINKTSGWAQSIQLDHYSIPDTIYSTLEFQQSMDVLVLNVIRMFKG